MNIFKKLGLFGCVTLTTLCFSAEETIRRNEIVIETLQKQLDSMLAKGEKEEAIKAIQSHIDSVIEQQNKLLEQKATGTLPDAQMVTGTEDQALSTATVDPDARLRAIVQEELAKAGITPKSTNPYSTNHIPSPAELDATKAAQTSAPVLPEAQTEAMAQYELALELYNKGAYKEAAASFGRIIKTYSKDPIAAKALVHLAYCLEKQGDEEGASIVCEAALKKKLDDLHQVDCHIIRLRHAKARGNEAEIAQIIKDLKDSQLTTEQQQALNKLQGKKSAAPAKTPSPAKTPAVASAPPSAG